jgi:HAMP domain-containing protein
MRSWSVNRHAPDNAAPGLILIALVLLSVVSLAMLGAGKARLDVISGRAFPTYQRATETKDTVDAIQTALQHTLSVAANESDVARIRSVAVSVRDAIAWARTAIDRLGQQIGPGTGSMIASHRLFEAYRAAATEVLSTVEADSATATMLMTDVDEQFAQLSADLDGYRSRADAVSQALSRDAMRAADRERLLLLSGTVLAVVVCIGILVAISRAIGRPVIRLTDTMAAMANDDLDRVVPALGHGDEIGAMARAVDVFRRNGLQARRGAGAGTSGETASPGRHGQAHDRFRFLDFRRDGVAERIGRGDAACRDGDGRSRDPGAPGGHGHRRGRRQGVVRSDGGGVGGRPAHGQRRGNRAPGFQSGSDRAGGCAQCQIRPKHDA